MRRAIAPAVLAAAAITALGSGAATAQTTNDAGLRYLSWPGKAVRPAPSAPAVPTARLPARPAERREAAPAPVPVASTSVAPAPASTDASRAGLTPAVAFHAAPAPTPNTERPYSEFAAPVAPAPAAPSQPSPEATPTVDPMAPRRDAAIFRLQPQAAPSAEAAPPAADQPVETTTGAVASPVPTQNQANASRYYSVHRQAGRQPDAIATPRPVYLDALPVEMAQTPASTDLAAPDAPPSLMRQANGTVRAAPQSLADDLP